MTALVRQLVDRIEALPESKRVLYVRRFLAQLEKEAGPAGRSEKATPDLPHVPFERIEHLAGILKGGPADLSTNPKYMEGFGERSMQ